MDSIGQVLKQERERRGLSLEEAHEATKITVQSIAALEGDRFESFPNKVYARAFLRDYANFLNLDSAQLLSAYEERWNAGLELEPVVVKKSGGSGRKAVASTLVALVVIGAVGAGGYFGWPSIRRAMRSGSSHKVVDHNVATLPKAPPVAPPKPEAAFKPEVTPKVETPVTPVAPTKAVLEVTALRTVWIGVKADGKSVFQQTLAQGKTMTFEGKKKVFIRAGMAGAVQLKFNGQPQPSLGSLKTTGEKEFVLPEQPAAVPTATQPSPTSATPAAAQPATH